MKKTKSIVIGSEKTCFFCMRHADGEHHLIFGNSARKFADEDGLKIPICNSCHNMGHRTERIHDNPMAERLSKMLGQAIYELKIGSREEFMKRYGRSYL